MRGKLGSFLLVLAAVTLIGVSIATPAQATTFYGPFTLADAGENPGWCLEGWYPPPTLDTNSDDIDPTSHLCDNVPKDAWEFQLVSTTQKCAHSYCGYAYYIYPYNFPADCLSQDNASHAYLTPCTFNDYQTWILYDTPSSPPIPLVPTNAFLVDYGSIHTTDGSTWCLSSNLTNPNNGTDDGTGTVFTAHCVANYVPWHYWYIRKPYNP